MIESPLIDELFADRERKIKQEAILDFLQARFGPVPKDVSERVRAVDSDKKLKALIRHAARCRDIEAFRERLPS